MTTLELKYNSFAVKTGFFINGREASLKCFGTGDKIRLRDYIKDFFPEAIKKSNVGPGEDCIIQFYGTQDTFEDVRKSYDEYMAQTAEDMNIKLPEYKPYPNNFSEVNKLIDDKRELFSDQLKYKREELINPSVGKSNEEHPDVVKRFDRDKAKIERLYSDCFDKINTVIEGANERVDFLSFANNVSLGSSGEKSINLFSDPGIFLFSPNVVKVCCNKIIEQYNLVYTNTYEKLTDLLKSLLKKIDADLYSGLEAVYKDYSTAYPDFVALNHPLLKYKQSDSFVIKEVIPYSCFSNISRLAGPFDSSNFSISVGTIKKNAHEAASSCQEYFDSVFRSTKQTFLVEIEKCKAYYLEELRKLQEELQTFQEIIKEKLSSTKQIEQEIIALENKIECLNDLQSELAVT